MFQITRVIRERTKIFYILQEFLLILHIPVDNIKCFIFVTPCVYSDAFRRKGWKLITCQLYSQLIRNK